MAKLVAKKKGGRPKIGIDFEKFKRGIKIGLSFDELIELFDISKGDEEYFFNIYKNNALTESGYMELRAKRIKRITQGVYPPSLKNKLKIALRNHIADMYFREFAKTVENAIGYPIEVILIDFESKFKEGMSWDNWGEWHIDHIKPRKLFDITRIKECFKLDNLQPLWKAENLKKGSNYDE